MTWDSGALGMSVENNWILNSSIQDFLRNRKKTLRSQFLNEIDVYRASWRSDEFANDDESLFDMWLLGVDPSVENPVTAVMAYHLGMMRNQ